MPPNQPQEPSQNPSPAQPYGQPGMNPEQAQIAEEKQVQRASQVKFYKHGGMFGLGSGAIMAIRDRVQLYEINPATNEVLQVLFDAPWSDISDARSNLNALYFKVSGKTFRIDFNPALTAAAGASGGLSSQAPLPILAADQVYTQSKLDEGINNQTGINDFQWWVAAFESKGIHVGKASTLKPVLIILAITFVIIGVVVALGG